ncbi:DrmB family protein [Streptomyces longispororuber]|uniref:DrmB family protein n=1 Tax=Streptomyces longispororuber TaxID=68230 RepID=UPI003700C0B8
MKDNRHRIRRTQTVSPFGVGGIVDLRGESFVAADVRSWGRWGVEVESPRLARKLGVSGFRAAPVIPGGKAQYVSRVGPGYVRFPLWLFCPKCRTMNRWFSEREERGKAPRCPRCPDSPQLAPMRFIQVCRDGHMADIDWRRWAHWQAEGHDRRQCQVTRLTFLTSPESSGLDALRVRCTVCGAGRSLEGITHRNALERLGLPCPGTHPWHTGDDERDDCEEKPRVVQRGASNVYFPIVHSAIEIPLPTAGEDREADILRVTSHSNWRRVVSAPDGPLADSLVQFIAEDCEVEERFVRDLLHEDIDDRSAVPSGHGAQDDLSIGEWEAFTSADPKAVSSREFEIRNVGLGSQQDVPLSVSLLHHRIDRVVAATRIREVRALEGFTRIESDDRERMVPANPATRSQWLPAVESYGEGVFIAFDEESLLAWEGAEAVREWVAQMEKNLESSFQADRCRERTGPRLLPRYVMLHTLAHQLIRQLSYDSGYNAASLRERVYARSHPAGSRHPAQAGVFIYTSAGDSEGTLGGLVRQGRPPHLTETVVRLLESAQWCSQDPLCSDSTGRSLANLNRAACHACTLLPETSCEVGNVLLDRTLLIGDGEVEGFFLPVIRAAFDESAAAVGAL